MFYVPQLGTADCGFACLKMLLASVHHNRQYLHLPCDENHGMYSYRELASIANENGVSLNGFNLQDKNELVRIDSLPAILRIKTPTKGRHAVLLYKINKKHAYIADPHLGKYKMKLRELFEVWDSTGLFIGTVKKVKYADEKFEPISFFRKSIAFILQVLSGVSIATGIYFINPEGPYDLPIIFLGLGLIFEILLRSYLYSLMKRIDKYFEEKYDDVNVDEYYEYYVRTQNFKKNYLSSKMKLLYSILVSIFVIFIIVFNNPLNFPLVVTSILLATIDKVILKKNEKMKLQKIADDEEQLKNKMSQKDMLMKVNELQDNAYKFSKSQMAKDLIGIMAFATVAILVQILTKSFTLIDIIFAVCIEVFLYQNLIPILCFEDARQQLYIDKAKLSNIFYVIKPYK